MLPIGLTGQRLVRAFKQPERAGSKSTGGVQRFGDDVFIESITVQIAHAGDGQAEQAPLNERGERVVGGSVVARFRTVEVLTRRKRE